MGRWDMRAWGMDEDHLARLQVVFRTQSETPPEMASAAAIRGGIPRDVSTSAALRSASAIALT